MLICGEPGIGKSRLVAEMMYSAVNGTVGGTVLSGPTSLGVASDGFAPSRNAPRSQGFLLGVAFDTDYADDVWRIGSLGLVVHG